MIMKKTKKIMSTNNTEKREKQIKKRRFKIEETEIFYTEHETGQRVL